MVWKMEVSSAKQLLALWDREMGSLDAIASSIGTKVSRRGSRSKLELESEIIQLKASLRQLREVHAESLRRSGEESLRGRRVCENYPLMSGISLDLVAGMVATTLALRSLAHSNADSCYENQLVNGAFVFVACMAAKVNFSILHQRIRVVKDCTHLRIILAQGRIIAGGEQMLELIEELISLRHCSSDQRVVKVNRTLRRASRVVSPLHQHLTFTSLADHVRPFDPGGHSERKTEIEDIKRHFMSVVEQSVDGAVVIDMDALESGDFELTHDPVHDWEGAEIEGTRLTRQISTRLSTSEDTAIFEGLKSASSKLERLIGKVEVIALRARDELDSLQRMGMGNIYFSVALETILSLAALGASFYSMNVEEDRCMELLPVSVGIWLTCFFTSKIGYSFYLRHHVQLSRLQELRLVMRQHGYVTDLKRTRRIIRTVSKLQKSSRVVTAEFLADVVDSTRCIPSRFRDHLTPMHLQRALAHMPVVLRSHLSHRDPNRRKLLAVRVAEQLGEKGIARMHDAEAHDDLFRQTSELFLKEGDRLFQKQLVESHADRRQALQSERLRRERTRLALDISNYTSDQIKVFYRAQRVTVQEKKKFMQYARAEEIGVAEGFDTRIESRTLIRKEAQVKREVEGWEREGILWELEDRIHRGS